MFIFVIVNSPSLIKDLSLFIRVRGGYYLCLKQLLVITIKSMEFKLNELKTMSQELSSKTILIQGHPNLKAAIRDYFLKTYALY